MPVRKAKPDARLTHLNARGEMHMVDIAGKAVTRRTATASAIFQADARTIRALVSGSGKKGDALAAARLAGILAAKRTPDLIPLAHPLALTRVEIAIALAGKTALQILATCETDGKTGVEMEALCAAAAAALTLYDMGKSMHRGALIRAIRLEYKAGGKSGEYRRGAVRKSRK